MNTRRGWKKFAFTETEKVSKTNTKKNNFLKSTPKKNFNFEEEIVPKTVDDLAVHIKKINDVEYWLQNNVVANGLMKKSSMLLITGPTGSGKTVTVKVLCSKLNIEITEWINPIDKDKDYLVGQTAQLLEFLSESKYPSLFCINKPKVILIEDFPNSVIHNPTEFVSVLEKCRDNKSSVIFICTDASSSMLNLPQSLFPQDIREQFSIYDINFNATSTTLLKKALKRAQNVIQEHLDLCNVPNQSIIDNIISLSMGDIRCAVNQFYFACLKASDDLSFDTIAANAIPKPSNKRKRNNKNVTKNQSLIKNERLSFFHGIGRVLNPKRIEKNDTWRLQCDISSLVEELSMQPSTFNSFIHANYLKYFGDINDICNAADVLSFAQRFLNKWENRMEMLDYALWIPIMGLMIHNEHRVLKWNQITRPLKFTKNTNYNMDTRSLNVMDRCYYNIINKCDYKLK